MGLILRTSNRGSKKEDTVYDFEIWYNSITKNIKNTCAKKSKTIQQQILVRFGRHWHRCRLARNQLGQIRLPGMASFPFHGFTGPSTTRLERCPTSWKNGVWPKNRMGSSSSRSFRFNGLMDPSFGFRSGLAAWWSFFLKEGWRRWIIRLDIGKSGTVSWNIFKTSHNPWRWTAGTEFPWRLVQINFLSFHGWWLQVNQPFIFQGFPGCMWF